MFPKSSLLALAATATLSFAQISDDFEAGLDNATWPIYAPDCNQGGTVTLDTSTAHSGSNSVKVVGGTDGGYCGHIFFGTTEVPASGDVYVRTWLKHTAPITDAHVTFIVMPDSGLSGKHLRLSGQMGIVEYNRESDDATLPDLSPDGIASSTPVSTDEWHCLEYHLSSASSAIETWFDGEAVTGLSTPNAFDNGWGEAYKPQIKGVYFGWESYAGSSDTWWYDDVAIDTARIGCGEAAAGSSPTKGAGAAQPEKTKTRVKTTKTAAVVETTSTSSSSVAAETTSSSSVAAETTSTSSVVAPVTSTAAAPVSTVVAPVDADEDDDDECEVVYVD